MIWIEAEENGIIENPQLIVALSVHLVGRVVAAL